MNGEIMQLNPDLINSLFPLVGTIFVGLNIQRLLRDKQVKGIHWFSPLFFYSGQAWGLYFMYTLNQYFSLFGGAVLLVSSLIWYSLMVYFKLNNGDIQWQQKLILAKFFFTKKKTA